MTTAIFKNGVLAVDRRVTVTGSHESCLDCGSERIIKDSDKLHTTLRPKARFQGELVHAIASAGDMSWCMAMREAMHGGLDMESANLFFQSMTRKTIYNSTPVRNISGSSIIIGESHVFLYRPMRGSLSDRNKCWVKFPFDTKQVLVIGSGGSYAHMAAMQGHGPVTACAMAGQYDYSAGQTINWIRVGERKLHTSEFHFPIKERVFD